MEQENSKSYICPRRGPAVSRKNRKAKGRSASAPQSLPAKTSWARCRGYLLAFTCGVVLAAAAFLTLLHAGYVSRESATVPAANIDAAKRTVAQIMNVSDAELEKVDILEMNIAVAREIPGLEKLGYDHYRQIVDGWTVRFRRWLPEAENDGFYPAPEKYKNDINFFRLGMLAQFLDQTVGVAYVEEQKQTQVKARKEGHKTEVAYTDPGHLLLHGLIDTKRGTCGTMPALHVAIGRRLGWPVGLACTNSHFVCRYDDGKVVYNIEATETGRGGFAEGSDQDYIERESVSQKAIAVGSDLRKLTGREMLGVFIAARARYYNDTGKSDLAARDYALAFTQMPNNRQVYIALVGRLVETGERLFAPNEHGHPASLAAYLAGRYQPHAAHAGLPNRPIYRNRSFAEVERINAINRRNMQRMMQPRAVPQRHQPPGPGAEQPPQPHQPR